MAEAGRYLVAPDSFKGTFSATEVAAAIGDGLREAGAEADLCPVADGGEGTVEALLGAAGGTTFEARVHDPLRRPITARFGLLADGRTAVVEVAAASGLPLVAPEERDAERADTFGTGELVAAAIEAGAEAVLVAAGGSATSDGGRGAIEALRESGVPAGLAIEVLCDVQTAYEDAARVFAPQKGADPAAVVRLSARLDEFATTLPCDPRGVPMGGCAGGLSGGLMAAFGARLLPGAAFVLEHVGFDARLAAADAVITGEGRFDAQSLQGKLVGTVIERAAVAGKPVHLITGADALDPAANAAPTLASVGEASTLAEIAEAARIIAV